jgi:predicted DNA-binding transcriptional regulator AlpA
VIPESAAARPSPLSEAASPATEFEKVATAALFVEPALVDDVGAGQVLGVSRATIQRLRATGRLPEPIRLGRLVRWRVAELRAFAAAGCPSVERWEGMRDAREAAQ